MVPSAACRSLRSRGCARPCAPRTRPRRPSPQAGTLENVASLLAAGFPLDTYVEDMNWHAKPAWGGYAWDTGRYPDPRALLAALHARGLATGINLHDADGVTRASNPALYDAFVAALGAPPGVDAVPFAVGNRSYADALQRVLLDPLVAGGVDVAWTDFQQGFGGLEGLRGVGCVRWVGPQRARPTSNDESGGNREHSVVAYLTVQLVHRRCLRSVAATPPRVTPLPPRTAAPPRSSTTIASTGSARRARAARCTRATRAAAITGTRRTLVATLRRRGSRCASSCTSRRRPRTRPRAGGDTK